jgi:formate dehydrogenase-N alpha subunit
MTNHFVDMKNADVVMIMGSNVVENHPIAARWLEKAKEAGSIVLNVDPRFTRTSSFADHYAKLRSGTDIAFVGGMIRYALENNYIQREYVLHYTNASFVVGEGYDFGDGMFAGFDQGARSYDKSKWRFLLDERGLPVRDMTLEHPRCVFQLLKKHFSRYTPEVVCSITGTPIEAFRKICQVYTSTWAPDRVGTWLYAMGTTQHSHGTQNIRTYAILQLLLGNVGLAGGGISALRGESNVQGSTDAGLLFGVLPGYLKSPEVDAQTLEQYNKKYTPVTSDPRSTNWWGNTPKYITSLLKAWWGDSATKENDFQYAYLPKRSGDYSHMALFEAMYAGKIKGTVFFGQNPAVGGPNSNMERKALEKLDWLVAIDLFETESSIFWKRPGADPRSIQTEVFLLPACSSIEKEGSISSSGRWAQWRYAAIPPLGDSRSDLAIADSLVKALRKEYASGGVFPGPIVDLHWNYGEGHEPDVHLVAKEINGYDWKTKKQIVGFAKLADDGSTCSGNWIYCGSYVNPEDDAFALNGNRMAKRSRAYVYPDGSNDQRAAEAIGLYPNWAWCWPMNRRILYNRASVDPRGNPWNPKKAVISIIGEVADGKYSTFKWVGDVSDGAFPPLQNPDGSLREDGRYPFIMKPAGYADLFTEGLTDGPFPEHYEPLETPFLLEGRHPLSKTMHNPALKLWTTPEVDDFVKSAEEAKRYPIVATTYRVSEHWQAGAITRNLPWLCELVPDVFVEIGAELARRRGIVNGDRVVVRTPRGEMRAYALVTQRFTPFRIGSGGRVVDQIGIPWHWGYAGRVRGDSANLLTPHVGDANTMIPEYKAFLCDLQKA